MLKPIKPPAPLSSITIPDVPRPQKLFLYVHSEIWTPCSNVSTGEVVPANNCTLSKAQMSQSSKLLGRVGFWANTNGRAPANAEFVTLYIFRPAILTPMSVAVMKQSSIVGSPRSMSESAVLVWLSSVFRLMPVSVYQLLCAPDAPNVHAVVPLVAAV